LTARLCAVCKKEIDACHWDQNNFIILDCCGHLLCLVCYGHEERENGDVVEKFRHLAFHNNDNDEATTATPKPAV
jgi:hypothetical protein